MKRLAVGLFVILGLSGCVTTAQHEAAKEKAAEEAYVAAYNATFKAMTEKGIEIEKAKELAREAGAIAAATARKAAEKIPATGTLGQILTTAFYALIQFGLPMLGKKVGVA